MTPAVFAVVLLAAALHAMWNAVVKSGRDTVMTTILVTSSAALIAIAGLPFLALPLPASWPFIAVSAIVHVGYFALVARTYAIADMSATYPLMRGTAPLLVAVASVGVLGTALTPSAWIGILAICAGILGMAAGQRVARSRGVGPALLNAVVIASYTLIDGEGVQRAGQPPAYALWLFLLTGVPLAVWAFTARNKAFRRAIAEGWRAGVVGGIGTAAAYGLVLWAMTAAPVAVVAALRETSILFGAAISGFVLKERVGPVRIAAACVIAAGAVALRLA